MDINSQQEVWWNTRHLADSQMVHLMLQRSAEGPLWLIYWCYKYIIHAVRKLCITGFQWYNILLMKLGGPPIISQTARWSTQSTGDHWMGRFDSYMDVINILCILLDSCISQLSSDIRYSTGSSVDHLSYHKQLDGPSDAPEITRQAALTDILMLQIYMIYG